LLLSWDKEVVFWKCCSSHYTVYIQRLSFGGCCSSHEIQRLFFEGVAPLIILYKYRGCLLEVAAPLMRYRGGLLEVVHPSHEIQGGILGCCSSTRYRWGLLSWKVVNNLWLCYRPISCYCLLFSFACHFFEKSRKTCRGWFPPRPTQGSGFYNRATYVVLCFPVPHLISDTAHVTGRVGYSTFPNY